MAGEAEPAKKVLLPYLQRADELQKHEPLVAYYCRLYAMERGLKIPAKERTKITNALLISLMNQLEKDKKAVQLSSEDNLYVEGFAQNVFAKADKQDRAGRADLNTAKTFYAASIFFEILHQFGPLQPDLEQKQKYAVWKAADIRKALNEGRRPVPGPPGDEEHLFDAVSGTEDAKLPSVTEPSKSSEQRQVIEQDPKGLSRMSSLKSNDSAVFPPQTMQNEYNHHYSGNLDHEVPHQPLDPAFLGYTTSYPGSHTPYAAMPDASTSSPSVQAHQYGVGAHLDEYNAQLYNPHYHLQEHGPASIMPNSFAVVNGSPGGSSYAQPTSSQFQNTSFYPSSSNEGFYSSGELESGRVNDASGIERTFSAPAVVKGQESYQPPPEKIAEAQKAARFAVSALAFDDVPTAISYLRQSLELLTNPSAASSHS